MAGIASLNDFRQALQDLPAPNAAAAEAARARDAVLTKPPGSLGRLEHLAEWLASWRGRVAADRLQVVIFAGNHGIAARGVSAFPAEVTVQMVANFKAEGAAVNQLSKLAGAAMSVHPIRLDQPTADFTQSPAMSEEDLFEALQIGWDAVDPQADILVAGEMGIANTTSAAAIASALFGGTGWAGRGTGVDDAGLARKEAAVAAGLAAHEGQLTDPLEVLRRLGGREIAAMSGAYLAARHHNVPVVLDGFISCAAAAVLQRANPAALDHCIAGHLSAEGAHGRLLEAIGKTPLLSLNMRLGEGSGAALALSVVKGAVACHTGMATFAEAGVSGA
ncbi:nicotinate-nucleotide--dimethylbenzimidazole phosphoribosyltransferase [Xinfangfangia sp. CPCC 101601]|uniref:Nicotinate-nucleotide--dimethylbenzimidazole phosphoribosyltransferase n=1 Tax=Pseudogemmobacter lacusdianii TaxID=3069608 RepID=A0ABU0VTE2_9RHOB|nr:nicotinate-nucleotide--dimethylbenzimidazole phosphoribosyltransferase [Xinfangfangia sp. CPCC 101601]MDQ2064989.1 nicotinate-nucleotide--dimethylbenzimidazole phosphoribosyltransferase [Xinfangfangia sp. CPCC 101601]